MDRPRSRLHERGQPYLLHCVHAAKVASEEDRPAGRLGGFQRCTVLPAGAGHVLYDAARLLRLLLCKSKPTSDTRLELTMYRSLRSHATNLACRIPSLLT